MAQMELQDAIGDLLRREGISQETLAARAGVSQATVSRALRREPSRRTAAYARLSLYMHQDAARAGRSPTLVLDAVRDTWDGSDQHAAALAKLILASRDLWPKPQKEPTP
jgi:transcriptional regulator with XRE-family HTH domain